MPETAPVILVVDDREENRYVSTRILRNAGYEVVEAGSGREALTRALENPAMVVLDVRLPDMIGYEVCRRLKANPQTANIPVLQVSASFTSSESRVQALDSGADAYLAQPLEPIVLVATVRALLRLREAEAFSRLSANQWQSTFDALSEGIALLDTEGTVVRCNRALTQLLGLGYGQIERQSVRSLLKRELELDLTSVAHLAGTSADASKERRWFSVRIDAVRDGVTERGAILIVSEITDRKLAEEALRVAERLAATGRLANSIAHEINNPLEAVTNLLYLLRMGVQDTQTAQYIDMAAEELDRVSRITKQTLAFNRETNEPVEIPVSELLDGVVTLYARQLSHQNIRVVTQYEAPNRVYGFPGELRQVFSNLLRNAMEAIPRQGHIHVRVHPSRDWKDASRRGVRISVADNGSGISDEVRHSIFEPFFTTKQLKGSGLGLWLTMGIVSKHKGTISVRSSTTPGRSGTCFSIFLPGKVQTGESFDSLSKDAVA